jgi:hypothetical protein
VTITRRHEAGFYSDDRFALDDLTQFIGAALKVGNATIVVATEPHRDGLPRLQACGLDIGTAIEQGRYIALDAADTLSTFMLNGMPDLVRFLKLFGDLVVTASKAAKPDAARVVIFGEMCHLLWAQGNAEAAIQVEKLGNQLLQTYDLDIRSRHTTATPVSDQYLFRQTCAELVSQHVFLCCVPVPFPLSPVPTTILGVFGNLNTTFGKLNGRFAGSTSLAL